MQTNSYRGTAHQRLVSLILIELSKMGFRAWKNTTGTGLSMDGSRVIKFGVPGSPDIMGIGPQGKFLGVEVKTGSGVLRQEQIAFRDMVRRQGGIFIEARSIEDVVQLLQPTGRPS